LQPYTADQDNLPHHGIVKQGSLSHLCLYNIAQSASIPRISELLSRITDIVSCSALAFITIFSETVDNVTANVYRSYPFLQLGHLLSVEGVLLPELFVSLFQLSSLWKTHIHTNAFNISSHRVSSISRQQKEMLSRLFMMIFSLQ